MYTISTKIVNKPVNVQAEIIRKAVKALHNPDADKEMIAAAKNLLVQFFPSHGEYDADTFEGVTVDGVLLRPIIDYTVRRGSTDVTLTPEYLKSLTPGPHTIAFQYQYGVAPTTSFAVAATPTSSSTPSYSYSGSGETNVDPSKTETPEDENTVKPETTTDTAAETPKTPETQTESDKTGQKEANAAVNNRDSLTVEKDVKNPIPNNKTDIGTSLTSSKTADYSASEALVTKPSDNASTYVVDNGPVTGDASNMACWLAALVAAEAVATVLFRKKKNAEEI